MCRLLAYVGPEPRSLRTAVGEATYTGFRDLARVHGDGWGMTWADPDAAGSPRVRRSVASAAVDPDFDTAATNVAATAGFLHLRWATAGYPVVADNTHPFVADGWAFAHNGFVRGSDGIERLLTTRHRESLAGTTDSERYFHLVLQSAEQTGDIVRGVQLAAQTIADRCGAVSINAMMLSSTRLLAVHGLRGAQPPLDDLVELFPDPAGMPADHTEDYFRLSYRYVGETLVIGSSGLPNERWVDLPAEVVMDVDLTTGDWEVHPLGVVAVSGRLETAESA
ncbi:MAG TPA: class II glutamine amidotransferase [Mycobacteriales bacterium]|nr:class II glutamine amidotransferase [Mycobacteriales bacterium]